MRVSDAALKVHKTIGPGLLKSVYEQCLAHKCGKEDCASRANPLLPSFTTAKLSRRVMGSIYSLTRVIIESKLSKP